MISETERGLLISSLHNINWDWDEGQAEAISLNPKIIRYMEDSNREEDFIVVEFRPSTRKYGMSLNNFVAVRDNPEYNDFGYGEEEIISITVMSRTKTYAHGRIIATDWLRRIQEYIRLEWEGLTTARILINSFTPYIEEVNFFAGRQYVYRMDFAMISHHGWTNEPVENPRIGPELVGIDVHDTLVWIERS